MFCTGCGMKLDMSRMKSGGSGRTFDLLGFLRGSVRVVIFLVVLVVVLLLIWPATVAGKMGKEEDVAALLGQRQALMLAIQNKQEVKLETTEAAVNAYLATTLKVARTNEEAVAVWMMNLSELNVAVQPGVLTVTTLAHWGPLSITWEISGVPKTGEGHFGMDVKSARIGHFGLPQAGADWMATRMAVLFNRWSGDRDMLDQLAGVSAETGAVTLVTKTVKQ